MTQSSATAFWITGRTQGELRDEALPPPGPDHVMVKGLFSGISRGTELLVYAGRVPLSERERMRCPFQGGDFPWPVKYGYSLVGRVTSGAWDLLGRTVFLLHPHQNRCVVPRSAVVPLPDQIPATRAVLAANMETALNGIWDGGVQPGDQVAVIGAGVVGLLVAYLASRIPAVTATIVDPDPTKQGVAHALGLPFHQVPPDDTYDLVFHASGQPAGLVTALRLASPGGTIVEMSWFGDTLVTLPLGEAFHAHRLTLRSSQVGTIRAERQCRWTLRRRLETSLALLGDDRLDVLISGESPFEALPEVMARLAAGRLSALCHRIRY